MKHTHSRCQMGCFHMYFSWLWTLGVARPYLDQCFQHKRIREFCFPKFLDVKRGDLHDACSSWNERNQIRSWIMTLSVIEMQTHIELKTVELISGHGYCIYYIYTSMKDFIMQYKVKRTFFFFRKLLLSPESFFKPLQVEEPVSVFTTGLRSADNLFLKWSNNNLKCLLL